MSIFNNLFKSKEREEQERWDAELNRLLEQRLKIEKFKVKSFECESVAITPDGKYIVAGSSDKHEEVGKCHFVQNVVQHIMKGTSSVGSAGTSFR